MLAFSCTPAILVQRTSQGVPQAVQPFVPLPLDAKAAAEDSSHIAEAIQDNKRTFRALQGPTPTTLLAFVSAVVTGYTEAHTEKTYFLICVLGGCLEKAV